MKAHIRFSSAPAAGFTLVEILIGLLIGMIGIVVIMQTFAVSEGYKRTATTGSDAQVNGGMALYLLEREIRLAGYGMNQLMQNGCTSVVAYNSSSGTTSSMSFVPFQINPAGIPAGDANSDVLLVTYGTSDDFPVGVGASQSPAGGGQGGDYIVFGNYDGFRAGDVVIAYQKVAGVSTCVLADITGVPSASGNCGGSSASGQADLLKHGTAPFQNAYQGCRQTTPTHNQSGGVKDPSGNALPELNVSAGGMLFNLGGAPVMKVFAVRNGNLTTCNPMAQDCTIAANYAVLVNGIVSLKAVYGQDTSSPIDGTVDQWSRGAVSPTGTVAVALEVTAKSTLKEKPSSGTACDTTTDPARPDKSQDWFGTQLSPNDGSLNTAQIDLSTSAADWQCYRYKLFQSSVPVRNMIWSPT